MCIPGNGAPNASEKTVELTEQEITQLRRDQTRRSRRGSLLILLSGLLFLLSGRVFFQTRQVCRQIGQKRTYLERRHVRWVGKYVAITVASVPWYLGTLLAFRAKRCFKKNAWLVLLDDHRPPILYLRSFKDDETLDPDFGFKWTRHRFMPVMKFNRVATEEALARTLSRHAGPVIAIGRPGESLPELGAFRLYVDDDHWQAEIRRQLTTSRLIVLRIGDSEGLLWELHQLLDTVTPERIVLFCPKHTLPDRVQQLFHEKWGIQLPAGRFIAFDSARNPQSFGEVGDVIMFHGLSVPKRGLARLVDMLLCPSVAEIALRAMTAVIIAAVAAAVSHLVVILIHPAHERTVFWIVCLVVSIPLLTASFTLPIDEPPMRVRSGK